MEMAKDATTEFDFDRWTSLAVHDHEAFERLREEAIDDLIESAPADMRQRLRGLQWQIDHVRGKSKTPMAACIRLSNMMWDRLVCEHGLVDALRSLTSAGSDTREPKESAEVLPLPRRQGPREPDV
jgi:Protein of unknown function (DUF3135)